MDNKDLRILVNLYLNQIASERLGEVYTEDGHIQHDVRQGYVMSLLLFNIYSEYILKKKKLEDMKMEILLNGNWINNI